MTFNQILVTGASGFIGRHTIKRLMEMGFEVYTLNHRTTDLLNPVETARELERVNPSHLLHLAWDVSPGYLVSASNERWVQASLGLLDQFIEAGGKHAVFAGSSFDIYATTTQYGKCKSDLLREATKRAQECGVSFAWGRVFQVYGPGEQQGRLIPYVIQSLLNNNPAYCTTGAQVRDFVYVSDVGEAFARLCQQELSGDFDVGVGVGIPVKEVVLEIGRQLDKQELLHFGEIVTGKTDPAYIVSDRPVVSPFDWDPIVSLPEGIAKCIEYWRQYGK